MPYKLTNTQWRKLQPYVSARSRRGRPPADARRTLEAVVYVLSSGCRWDELPQDERRRRGRHLPQRLVIDISGPA